MSPTVARTVPLRRTALRLLLPAAIVWAGVTAGLRADDWPQWLGPKRDGVWRETGLLDRFPKDGPKVLWKIPIGGGYTGPAVVGDRVYVMDRVLPDTAAEPAKPDAKGNGPGSERVLCLDAANGKVVWKHEYDCTYRLGYPAGPRTTPLVHDGKVYTLGAMGDLNCLEAASGKVVWSHNFPKEYQAPTPVWGWSASLLLDGDRIVSLVGGKGSAVVAFHKDTGKEAWRALTAEEIGYCPPTPVTAGGKRQLVIWHGEAVNGLEPETGNVLWTQPYPPQGKPMRPVVNIATPRQDGDLLLISSFYHGPLMLKLGADGKATEVWRGKEPNVEKSEALHALMSTPVLKDGHIYGVSGLGELRCLKADTGERLWETYEATGGKQGLFANAFLVPQGDRFFLFNDQGDLIIARLTPKGYEEIDRAHLLNTTLTTRGRDVTWCHPAFANRCVYVRNDKEMLCVSMAGA
jgi:outer membrane protein assembly factor BamB